MPLQEVKERLSAAKTIAIDFETHNQDGEVHDLREARVIGIALAVDEPKPWSTYLDFNPQTTALSIAIDEAFDALRPILEQPDKIILAHNAKFDRTILKLNNIDVDGHIYCTLHEATLVDENRPKGLKKLVMQEFNKKRVEWKDTIKPGSLFGADMSKYGKEDAEDALNLHRLYWPIIKRDKFDKILQRVVMPSVEIGSDMSIEGVKVDIPYLTQLEKEQSKRLLEIEKEANHLVGRPIKLSSTQIISTLLFEELGIDPPEGCSRGVSGFYSTNNDVLNMVMNEHAIVPLILEHRSLEKNLGTYVTPFRNRALQDDGRIRPDWKPCRAETGRWRCSKPNLQNIPREDYMRKIFIPEPGNLWIAADYSQLELRLAAYMSGDETMLQIYEDGGDIHKMTCDLVGCVRYQGKVLNFSLIYGMSPTTLRTQLWRFSKDKKWITEREAAKFHQRFFESYPGIKRYHNQVRKAIKEYGYVETITGRRRRASDPSKPREAFQELVNARIQGSAADLVGLAIWRFRNALKVRALEDPRWSRVKILLQVHDEIDCEAPEEIAEECANVLKISMEETQLSTVPIIADVAIGTSWSDAKG